MSVGAQADWLQRLGGKWPPLALGYRYEVQLGKMLDEKQISGAHLRPYLRNVDVQWGKANVDGLPEMDFDELEREKFSLRPGDLLVCEGGEVGRAALWTENSGGEVYFQKALHRLRPREPSQEAPRYLFYALRAAAEMNAYGSGGKTTIAHLPAEAFRRVRFPRPPKVEQERIANFLDEQTARIDALIAEKERLLELLAEQRLSVAEGVLAPAQSGQTAKLGFFVDLLPGYAFPANDFSKDPCDVPLLRGINVAPSAIRWDDVVYWPREQDSSLKRFKLRKGDVVFGMDRPWISTGARVAMVDESSVGALLLQRVCRLRGGDQLQQRFLYFALSSDEFRQSIEIEMTGISVPHISPEQVLRFKVPVLSRDEQAARFNVADASILRIEQLESHTTEMLGRLREYRSSLISAAVTGQLDVNTFEVAAHSDLACSTT